jgi:hypothetical protein
VPLLTKVSIDYMMPKGSNLGERNLIASLERDGSPTHSGVTLPDIKFRDKKKEKMEKE